MAFVTPSEEILRKSTTDIENKFITKYMPELDPVAVKVYLYLVYICRNSPSLTMQDLCQALSVTEEDCANILKYLEEYELISVISMSPCEVKILDVENVSGAPKRYKPEKYSDFAKAAQGIITGRMIDTGEYQEYFSLIEEGFDQNALLMVITYCVDLKGPEIRKQYIIKVARNFEQDGDTTVRKVEDRLSNYSASTAALIKIFSAAGLRRQPDVSDDKFYKKWTAEMGFSDDAIICAARHFKAKSVERIDAAMEELYNNKKFAVKEIEDYCDNRSSIYSMTIDIAKSLGVYIQNCAPYVENYMNGWISSGYSRDSLLTISRYCFRCGMSSFDGMNDFIQTLYSAGIVSDGSVESYLEQLMQDDKLIKQILSICGISRRIVSQDRARLSAWREWSFPDEMILEAAKISVGKSNPIAYMNGILSGWKKDGIYKPADIPSSGPAPAASSSSGDDRRAEIERHYYNLRTSAELKAEQAQAKAKADPEYAALSRELTDLNIKLAFAELRSEQEAAQISGQISSAEAKADLRLKALGISKDSLTPHYSCSICNDTGYDSKGLPCACLKKFLGR
ncbi:MAG: DnaD domain protein [Clostridia bacterium]|nr:DnaD domain protein [Clostridia bacterium]